MACNARLADITKDRAAHLVPRRVEALHEEFRRCPDCGRLYWKVSHYRRMVRWIRELSTGLKEPEDRRLEPPGL
jgi:uncharacterized protein with PIN domain